MDRIASSFHRLLKNRGLKSTRQRDTIIQMFMESGKDHLSVDELYQRVRQRNPKIGYATVYRTLRLMAESGWASSRQFGNRTARFERQTEGQHHDHLICMGCGKIVEFENPRIEELQAHIARLNGFQIFEHKLELYGNCPTCLFKEKRMGKNPGKSGEHE
jgi:Fur family ferric uptake transcriptional regulator